MWCVSVQWWYAGVYCAHFLHCDTFPALLCATYTFCIQASRIRIKVHLTLCWAGCIWWERVTRSLYSVFLRQVIRQPSNTQLANSLPQSQWNKQHYRSYFSDNELEHSLNSTLWILTPVCDFPTLCLAEIKQRSEVESATLHHGNGLLSQSAEELHTQPLMSSQLRGLIRLARLSERKALVTREITFLQFAFHCLRDYFISCKMSTQRNTCCLSSKTSPQGFKATTQGATVHTETGTCQAWQPKWLFEYPEL